MRNRTALAIFLCFGSTVLAQPLGKEVPRRFDVLHNPDLYGQATAKEALTAVLRAIERERYDYMAAHLLDPAFVDGRLAITQEYFDRLAAEEVAGTAAGQTLTGKPLLDRIHDIATRRNVRALSEAMRRKVADDPDSVTDLKRFAREGKFDESGDSATATLPDVKDRALYFKKIDGRWFLENRREDRPGKE